MVADNHIVSQYLNINTVDFNVANLDQMLRGDD